MTLHLSRVVGCTLPFLLLPGLAPASEVHGVVGSVLAGEELAQHLGTVELVEESGLAGGLLGRVFEGVQQGRVLLQRETLAQDHLVDEQDAFLA